MNSFYVVLIGFVAVVIGLALAKVLYDMRRTLGVFFATLIVLLASMPVIVALVIPLIFARLGLWFFLRRAYMRSLPKPRMYLRAAYRADEAIRSITGSLFDVIPGLVDYSEVYARKAADLEEREYLARSFRAFLRNKDSIVVEVSWDSSLEKNKVTFYAYRKGDTQKKAEDVWELEHGIANCIKRKFVEIEKPDKQKGKSEVVLWNKGFGAVTYCDDGRLDLHYENVQHVERSSVEYHHFKFQHPYLESKEAKRCKLHIDAEFNKDRFIDFNAHAHVIYGDEYALPADLALSLQEKLLRDLRGYILRSVGENCRLTGVHKGRIHLYQNEEMGFNMSGAGLGIEVERTVKKTEAIYQA